jgi:1-acyl-sn-glycerol-3-phosphate acyltransferase
VLPPRWIRRLVLTPAVPLFTLLLLALLPVWLVVAAVASVYLPGRWRALRVLAFLLVYLLADTVMLVRLLLLWIASGFGARLEQAPWPARHYAAMRTYLAVLVTAGRRIFKVGFDVDMADLGFAEEELRRPVLIFSRHAGPGDSFLLVHSLLQRGRHPRIVLKDTLQWSPVIDIGLNRVPTFFVGRGAPPGTGTRAIRTLAEGLGSDGALVLFPEGRNWTPRRRLRSIDKLEAAGMHHEAEVARELRHVLSPRSGGALAALEGAPTANVAFVAHTGLEHFTSLADVWRGIPIGSDVSVKGWWVPRREVPRAREAREAWLQWWWRRIDAWLIDHLGAEAVPDAVVEAVEESGVEPAPE